MYWDSGKENGNYCLGFKVLGFKSVFLRHGIQAEVGREAKRTCHAVSRLGSLIHF